MLADGISASGSNVITGAIQKAAQLTGASFAYLVATAQVESNFNPRATVSTSSAGGLFQFIEQTWLSTLKQAGPSYGYGSYANAITRTAAGRYEVTDPKMRRAIMQLRNDPTANSVMAGVFTKRNAAKLAGQIGRPPSDGELYIAHFLGAAGAGKLISTASANPGASAAAMFPAAAHANPAIFYDQRGGARSAAQVYSVLVGKFDAAHASLAAQSAPASPVPAAARDTAGFTSALASVNAAANVVPTSAASNDGQVFHSLFQAGERREPIDPLVNQLWSPQTASASAPQTGTPTAAGSTGGSSSGAVDVLGLFRTQPANSRALFERGGS